MPIRNTVASWGSVARFFHWVGAAVVLFLLLHGFWMTAFPPRDARLGHYATHAAVGYALIALMALRLLWRWMNAVPAQPGASSRLEVLAAHAGHWGLYLLVLAASFSGWALAGTFRTPQPLHSFFGLFQVPALVSGGSRSLHELLEETHVFLAWALVALVAIHVAAALWHWLYRKDDVMQRMLR